MMFGSQVNPSLGAANYGAFLSGAQQGAAGIGQGIAGIGAGIADAIKGYYTKQEEKRLKESATQFLLNAAEQAQQAGVNVPQVFGLQVDQKTGKFDKKAASAAVNTLGPGVVMQFIKFVEPQIAATKEQRALSAAAQYFHQTKDPAGMAKVYSENGGSDLNALAGFVNAYANMQRVGGSGQPAQSAPEFYQYSPDGSLRPIPGGRADPNTPGTPAYNEAQALRLRMEEQANRTAESAEKAAEKKREEQEKANKLAEAEARALRLAQNAYTNAMLARKNLERPFAQGFGAGVAATIGGTPAANQESLYKNIRANAFLDTLREIKKLSPTGQAGFGNLAIPEMENIQSEISNLSLSTSDEQAKAALDQYIKFLEDKFPGLKASAGQPAQVGRFRVIPGP